jgi:hypothetical protein
MVHIYMEEISAKIRNLEGSGEKLCFLDRGLPRAAAAQLGHEGQYGQRAGVA